VTKLGSRKLHVCPKVTKMGSIIGHRIDYNGGRGSESPAAHTWQKLTQVTPGLNKSDDKAQDTNEEILDDGAQDETDEAIESDLV